MPSFIAVITRAPQTRRQIARALYAGGMELRFSEKPADLEALISRDRPELVIVDIDTLDVEGIDQVLRALEQARRVATILISLGADKKALLGLLRRYELGNLVAKHGAIRAVYPVLDERELLVTCNKVVQQDLFGIDKYIGLWSVKLHHFTITSMADKYWVMSEFEGFLTDLECPPVVVPDMLTVADELMLNAIVHAPRGSDGTPRYESRGPSPDLKLQPDEHVEVAFACDGQRMMFSVSDRFGTLARETVYDYITKGFVGGRQSVEQKASGAGLGLSMAFRRVHQIVFNIHESVRTEVIAGWYLRVDSASEFRQVSKSMNLFWLPKEEVEPRQAPLPEPAKTAPPEPVRARRPLTPASVPKAHQAPAAASARGRIKVMRLSGRIDERFRLQAPEGRLRLDLRAVTGLTSSGVLAWMSALESVKGRGVELTALPEFFVRAASEVEGILGDTRVLTVLAPFECRHCVQVVQLELPPDEVLTGKQPECSSCGAAMTFSGLQWEYEALSDLIAELRAQR